MDSLPQQPDQRDEEVLKALERRKKHLQDMATTHLSTVTSWGERILPAIFAAMETCWVDAIFIGLASIHFFQLQGTIMPLWAPFVLITGTSWLITYLERRDARSTSEGTSSESATTLISGSPLIFVAIAVVILLIIWSGVYAPTTAFYDPGWLLATLNDLLLLSSNAYHIFGILVLGCFFCWRGTRLARRTIEPGDVFIALRLGMGVIVAVIVIRAGAGASFADEGVLLLLIPLFLTFALIAHSLSHVLSMRSSYTAGLQGSVAAQERALLLVVGTIGVFLLLIGILVGTLASPTFFTQTLAFLAPLGVAYDWFATGLAYAIVFLMTPFFWLISQLHPSIQLPRSPFINRNPPQQHIPRNSTTPETVVTTLAILKVVLPLLVIAAFIFLIWLMLKRRRVVLTRKGEDTYESLWSWALFWMQLKALLLALWRRFFPQPAVAIAAPTMNEAMTGEPMARSIREIYRALLQWASKRGSPRHKDETPFEFKRRLDEQYPAVEPELRTVTEMYNEIRYGNVVPEVADVVRVQKDWVAFQQKTQN